MSEPIRLERVSESMVAAIDPRLESNAAAIIFDEFIVSVDVGMRPYASRMLRAELESAFERPVRFVCVTHLHPDHTYGLSAFKDVTVFGSRQLADGLAQSSDWTPEARAQRGQTDAEGGAWLDEVELVFPSLLFHRRMDLIDNGRVVEFHHAGGHTDCSVYAYFPEERVLCSGDLIFSGWFPFAGDRTADPESWMSTLRTWLTMDIDRVIPGHGPVAGKEEIAKQLQFLEDLKQNTLEAIAAGRDHPDIEIPSVYPINPEKEWFVGRTLERWHSYYRGRASE